ncbi:MAG: hypothetical protein JW875_08585 [Spirochaetales bacterium]|nr:hypothetical protein [Spirochaetales bacterium]
MVQFYFLSILLNTVTGLILFLGDEEAENNKLPAFAYNETFRLLLGMLTAVTGFFKLLTAIRGDVPVIGDLFPALAGLAGGCTLLYEFYKIRSTVDEQALPDLVKRLVTGRRYIGLASIIAAAAHFLFPIVIFL